MLLMCPTGVWAAGSGETTTQVPVWLCIPFAVMPLIKAEWWEAHQPHVVLMWILLMVIPFAVVYGTGKATETVLECIVNDYLTFIVLLFGLFCVSGNITMEGDFAGSPRVNVCLLAFGTLLSSCIGTTGASMLMIRPMIRANKWRRRKVQVMVFFIFLVSNIGGCLTPVGDPPLLMGFMNGVDFFWSLNLLPVMILNVVLLLALFYVIDSRAYKKDLAEGAKQPEVSGEHKKLRLNGAHNIIFLLMIIVAVILSGVLPKTVPFFKGSIHFYGEVELGFASILEMVMILAAAFLSYKTTKKEVREANHFTWDAIQEVATLFIGIFVTMIPALLILKARGASLGVNEPWQYFWMTGLLSSFLDNTPTYLVFFTTAASSGLAGASMISTAIGQIPKIFLMAISCGAVFMGANTYIGNAPNFMVRSIAEENDIKMPSFFGYMGWSIGCLIPVFIIDMLVFFIF